MSYAKHAIAVALSLASVSTISSTSSVARAENAPTESSSVTSAAAEASTHFRRGIELYEDRDFRAALVEFTRANSIAPNNEVVFNVAQCLFQLGNYAEALATMERYKAAASSLKPERAATVESEIADLQGRVATIVVRVNVPDATIAVDELQKPAKPSKPIRVSVGRRTLTISARGYLTVTRVVELASGDSPRISIQLEREPEPSRGRAPAFIALGVGGVGVVVGAAFGLLAIGNKSNLEAACNGGVCPRASQSNLDGLNRNGVISTVGFGVGALGLVVSAYLFLRPRNETRAVPSSTAFGVSPTPTGIAVRF